MAHPDWELLEEADWLFRKMVRRFVKERDKIAVEGISLPGMLVLHKIIRDGQQRLGDLAEELDFTSGAMTGLCDKLEEEGYAVRIRRDEDRRTVLLDVTDAGREMFRRNRNIGRRCITALFEGFTADELNEQIRSFRRMLGNLEGFSSAILALAQTNAERKEAIAPADSQSPPERTGTYLSY